MIIGTLHKLKKKSYETSHSGLSLKIRYCSIFGNIKKTTCEGSLNAQVLLNNGSTFLVLWKILAKELIFKLIVLR